MLGRSAEQLGQLVEFSLRVSTLPLTGGRSASRRWRSVQWRQLAVDLVRCLPKQHGARSMQQRSRVVEPGTRLGESLEIPLAHHGVWMRLASKTFM